MPKRQNPFPDDAPVQSKVYVTAKEMDRCSEKRMAAVHAKTLRMLFSGSRKAAESHASRGLPETQGKPCAVPCSSCSERRALSTCGFCDRTVCAGCLRTCSSCDDGYCPLCSLLRYDRYGERAVCLSCGAL